MNKSKTKDDCYFYNWGNGYPREYGARCEFHETFFSSKRQLAGGYHEKLKPNCKKCDEYTPKIVSHK